MLLNKYNSLKIFICYTPFHFFISRLIRDRERESASLLVDVNGVGRQEGDDGKWDYIINRQFSEPFGQSQSLKTQVYKLKNAKAIFNLLDPELQRYARVQIFYSHLNEFLNNFLFFKYRKADNITFNVLQDGILNYYKYREIYRRIHAYLTKSVIGIAMRFPFHPFLGLMSGIDQKEVKQQYLLGLKDLSDHPEKFKLIDLSKVIQDYPTEPKTDILLLGQEACIDFIGRADYDHLSDRLSSFALKLQKSAGVTLYYKPHHQDPSNGYYSHQMQNLGFHIEMEQIPIEELMLRHRFNHVVSFSSSGLINIKLMFGKLIQCWAVNFDLLLDRAKQFRITAPQYWKLRELFEAAGVDFV